MKYLMKTTEEIIRFLSASLQRIDTEQFEKFTQILLEAKAENRKVLLVGAGRSGLVAKAFAMRMMHLTFDVHVIGETITPAIGRNDVLIAISGSGTTTIVVTAARLASKLGAKVVALTSHHHSPLARYATHVVILQGRTKLAEKRDYFSRQILGLHDPLAPLGTIFEVVATVFLDGLVVELMKRLGKSEAELKARHATIE